MRQGAAVVAAVLMLVDGASAGTVAYGPPQRAGVISSRALAEVSGLVASRSLRGGWWAVNDSGNPPLLHAVDARGRLVASLQVGGATNRDWEDLAAGPGPGGRFLYIGDIGDNDRVRDDLVVYRVREPALAHGRNVRARAFPFRYPDGRFDAEALLVDPVSGHIYLITKGARARVYRFPLPLRPGRRVVLERVRGNGASQIAALELTTGAAISPDGSRIALRNYWVAYELRRGRGRPFESRFTTITQVNLRPEPQGEAISYTRDGGALVTTSEQPPAPIWRYPRRN